MSALSPSNLLSYLTWGIPTLAVLAYAAIKFAGPKKDKTKDQDEEKDDLQPEPPKLRTRPLKPAVDLSIYNYM